MIAMRNESGMRGCGTSAASESKPKMIVTMTDTTADGMLSSWLRAIDLFQDIVSEVITTLKLLANLREAEVRNYSRLVESQSCRPDREESPAKREQPNFPVLENIENLTDAEVCFC